MTIKPKPHWHRACSEEWRESGLDAEKSVGGKRYGPAEQEIGSIANGTRSGKTSPGFAKAGGRAGRRHRPDREHLSNLFGRHDQSRPSHRKFSFSWAYRNRKDKAGGSSRGVSGWRRPLSAEDRLRRVSAQP